MRLTTILKLDFQAGIVCANGIGDVVRFLLGYIRTVKKCDKFIILSICFVQQIDAGLLNVRWRAVQHHVDGMDITDHQGGSQFCLCPGQRIRTTAFGHEKGMAMIKHYRGILLDAEKRIEQIAENDAEEEVDEDKQEDELADDDSENDGLF